MTILLIAAATMADIQRIWLTHRSGDPRKIVVNWESAEPGDSVVAYGPTADYGREVRIQENVTLHHVEIPRPDTDVVTHYRVSSGAQRSTDATFSGTPTDVLRVAAVSNWQRGTDLSALVRDQVHLLLTAGDNVPSQHQALGVGVKEGTKAYGALIDAYPALFRSTPFMPALGNHDREIRPRGARPPPEPVYDIEASAFRSFFELPDDEWKWRFDVPVFGVRFVALDLSHLSDQGTTWQTCHPCTAGSPQFEWYRELMAGKPPPFTITIYNERNATVRGQEKGAWHRMIRSGTAALSGFGYFAEAAEHDGFPYYNTSVSGKGDRYPDPGSRFLESQDNYVLMTFTRGAAQMLLEIKGLDGTVLHAARLAGR